MISSYRHIRPDLARRIRMVVTDIDGTVTAADRSLSVTACRAVQRLEESDIMVGLASGRALPLLENVAEQLGISGPIIAENGGVAKLHRGGAILELGFNREPSLKALEKLRALYSGTIEQTEDDRLRMVDVGIKSRGVEVAELKKHLDGVQLLDSGFMLHLLPDGISKGATLLRLLGDVGDGRLSRKELMVFGDSTTDISLFEVVSNSVLIVNPRLTADERRAVEEAASYVSELENGDGFAQVVEHILGSRRM